MMGTPPVFFPAIEGERTATSMRRVRTRGHIARGGAGVLAAGVSRWVVKRLTAIRDLDLVQ